MAANETLSLDSLSLNDGTTFTLEALEMPPPPKRAEWVGGADADGDALIRDPLVANREITALIRVEPQSTMDLALAKIGQLVDKLEEAERQPDGLALVWTPADATKTMTFYVLSGEVSELPVTPASGWFVKAPLITIRMTAKPFGYGTEVTGSTATSTSPVVTVTQGGVTGDVPAEGRLVVTDMASKARRHVEWGLEQRYYDAATSLLINSSSFTLISGTTAADAGAYNGDRVQGSSFSQPTGLASISGAHVGTFRVKARCTVSNAAVQLVRLAWKVSDGPLRPNAWATFPLNYDWVEVDLGLITIPPVSKGAQQWTGRIEVITTSGDGGDAIYVDYVILIPVSEGYGKARGPYAYTAGTLVARDPFTATTAGNALNARGAPVGGSWVTSGATTDFVFEDDAGGGESITRTTTGDSGTGRYAILGSTSYTDVEVGAGIYFLPAVSVNAATLAVLARYVDTSNYLEARLNTQNLGFGRTFGIYERIAGTTTVLQSAQLGLAADWYAIRIVVFASGRIIATLMNAAGGTLAELSTTSANAATGGTLATGKPGLRDFNPSTACTRNYDNFWASIPPAEPIVINSGRAIEFRSDDPLRQDTSGTYWGAPPSYRGSRFLLPPAGDENRTSRIAVKARRTDVDSDVDNQIADSTKVEVFYTPRYYAIPR